MQEDIFLPLVEQYLASIPACEEPPVMRADQITALPHQFPQGVVVEDVRLLSFRAPVQQCILSSMYCLTVLVDHSEMWGPTGLFSIHVCMQVLKCEQDMKGNAPKSELVDQ